MKHYYVSYRWRQLPQTAFETPWKYGDCIITQSPIQWLVRRRKRAVYEEIEVHIVFWREIKPEDVDFVLDEGQDQISCQ